MAQGQQSGGYPPPGTYPPPSYGQQQPAYQAQPAYGQPYQAQPQYQPYAAAQPAPAAAPPPKKSGVGKIWVILLIVGLVLSGVGWTIIGALDQNVSSAYNAEQSSPSQGNLKNYENAQWASQNMTGIMELLVGIGFIVTGIGAGLFCMAISGRIERGFNP
jgi:hypothetical protein